MFVKKKIILISIVAIVVIAIASVLGYLAINPITPKPLDCPPGTTKAYLKCGPDCPPTCLPQNFNALQNAEFHSNIAPNTPLFK